MPQSNNTLKTKEVRKASKIRIYPNKETRQYFEHCFRDNHIAYNYFVERYKADYEQYKAGEMWGYLELFENTNMGKYYAEMKNNGYFSGESDSRIKNYVVKALEAAKFISNGFPQFKSWKKRNSFSYTTGQALKIVDGKLKIPKCNSIPFKDKVYDTGVLKQITITKTRDNKYYASLSYDKVAIEPLPKTGKIIGIDLGIKDMATLSNGFKSDKLESKRFDEEIRLHQQRMHRKVRRSNNRYKARAKLSKVYNSKKDYLLDKLHWFSHKIVNNLDEIYVGDVNSQFGLANHKLAKSTSDSHWYEFKRQLEYKSSCYAKVFKIVNERWTSKT